jgi:uncharacterized protein YgiM (DUF1202 family)
VTPTTPITVTTVTTPTTPAISSTANITANLRGGPGITFNIVGQVGLGQPIVVAGISADGAWYLLDTLQWIAVGLVDNAPANPLIATDALIAQLQARPTPTPTTVLTTTGVTTPTVAPILVPTPTPVPQVILPTVTTNANLRAGPGTQFALLGGTIAGQTINIVARNEAGDWFLLDNGGWVAAFLVANPPALATLPISGADQVTPTTPVTTTPPLTTTAAVTPTAVITTTTLGIRDNLYLIDANEAIARYERALDEIDQLTAQAGQNAALLQDQTWIQSITTAIALLQATDTRVRGLEPTPALQAVHDDLVAAAAAYDSAAALLTQAVDQRQPASFDAAFAEITRGNALLVSATRRIDALTP